jgi:Ser/Thr protein kinase RdoA (MazF antagonist)
VLERFGDEISPRLTALPAQAVHNDANEHNVLLDETRRVSGLIDFGDLCRAPKICGLAVACAYAMTSLRTPERELPALVTGYHELSPLAPAELALLPDLIRARLALSMAMATRRQREQPENRYLLISQDAVTDLLGRLGPVPAPLECWASERPRARARR